MQQQQPMPMMIIQPSMMERGMHDRMPDIVVPPRINKALDFMGLIAHKQQTRAAISEHQIELIPGIELTEEETTAFATANNLLTKYFAGQLPHDKWEELRYRAQERAIGSEATTRVMHCMACMPGPINPKCPLCGGRGRVLISPAGPVREDQSDGSDELEQE